MARQSQDLSEKHRQILNRLKNTIKQGQQKEEELLRTNVKPEKATSVDDCPNCGEKAIAHCEICGDPFCPNCLVFDEGTQLLTCEPCKKAL